MTDYINYFKDYKLDNNSMFLNGGLGLMDTVNKRHKDIWGQYKLLKSLDWSENEVDYSPCNAEFKTVPKEIKDMMIRTLAWQWEADSSAITVSSLLAPFVSSSELQCYLLELAKNECLHSITYSEIVRCSFDDPDEVISEMLAIKENFARLKTVSKVFSDIHKLGAQVTLGIVNKDDKIVRETIVKFMVTLLCLERIQFIPSFSITFAMAEYGNFLPIAKIVQKIFNDEFQVHVQADKIIINNELNTQTGMVAYMNISDEIDDIISEIVNSELDQMEFIFGDNEQMINIRKTAAKKFVLFCANDVYKFLNIENTKYEVVEHNPLPYMDKWVNINANQASPQEENVVNYLLGRFIDDSDNIDESISKLHLTF